jgi:hypothetical protein
MPCIELTTRFWDSFWKKIRSQLNWTNFGKIRMNFGLNPVNFRNVKRKIRFGPHQNGRISPKFGLLRSNPVTYLTVVYQGLLGSGTRLPCPTPCPRLVASTRATRYTLMAPPCMGPPSEEGSAGGLARCGDCTVARLATSNSIHGGWNNTREDDM